MKFTLNGEPQEIGSAAGIEDGITVQSLLERFELTGRRVAVAINGAVVPKSRFADTCVEAGDRVEVIHAVGGG